MDEMLSAHCEDLARIISRLELINVHDALVLLKNSFSAPRLQFTLRSAPCTGHPRLDYFDQLLHTATSKICNVHLSDDQWLQASLPGQVWRSWGSSRVLACTFCLFGICCGHARATAPPAGQIRHHATDPTFDEVMQQWLSMSNAARPTDFRQRAVDNLVVEGSLTFCSTARQKVTIAPGY
jgi:hypothetical protein